jgi:hypothetical protein
LLIQINAGQDRRMTMLRCKEQTMSIESAVVVMAIVLVFVGFAAVLAWADLRGHQAPRH